eukprot:scaffold153311_cov32-Prasinocladus_malaysianus.AAC.1
MSICGLRMLCQVLKKHLSMIAPSVRTDEGLGYEEGDDLEDDERAAYQKLLPKALADLPGRSVVCPESNWGLCTDAATIITQR